MKLLWRVAARFNEARYRRAAQAAVVFKARAEKFYRRIMGVGV
jgi:hypothetical protein